MPVPQRYAVIHNGMGRVVNVVVWDGVTPWSPPAGTSVMQTNTANPSDTAAPVSAGVWTFSANTNPFSSSF